MRVDQRDRGSSQRALMLPLAEAPDSLSYTDYFGGSIADRDEERELGSKQMK